MLSPQKLLIANMLLDTAKVFFYAGGYYWFLHEYSAVAGRR